MKKFIFIFITLSTYFIISCDTDEVENPYGKCNDLLSACAGLPEGEFCTFGYKWGGNNPFPNAGLEASGPGVGGGRVSYSFSSGGINFNTHSETNITTLSFSNITVCESGPQVRRALMTWESVTNIEFIELPNDSEIGDIRFMVADIEQGGIGSPNYTDDFCSTLAGQVIIDVPTRNTCDGFYNLLLHEIGHVLGLGHVNSNNIMNPANQTMTELGTGDIAGVQSIYGEKN